MNAATQTDDPGSLADHPFVMRLSRLMAFRAEDLRHLERIIVGDQMVKKRKDLVVVGNEFRNLCLVRDGYAIRYKVLRSGKRQILNVILPGDVVGFPVSFFDRSIYSVVAVSDLAFSICPFDSYVRLCYEQPQFGLLLSWFAAYEAAIYAEHIVDTGRRTPLERLARLLLEIHWRLEAVGYATASSFELPFSQEVLGDVLGLSVPHLNRMVARLRADGLISIVERRVEFADLPAIRRFCHFQPLDLVRIPPRDSAGGTSQP
jgi:CRP-like cAMP-binding protein